MKTQSNRRALSFLVVLGLLTGSSACNSPQGSGSAGDAAADGTPQVDPADFVAVVDNPFFPLTPGTMRVYEGEKPDGLERVEVLVTDDTREILGVTCTVVRDTVALDGETIEDTFDWYAQDRDGNVWYFGEDSRELEDGQVVSTEGSWEGGVDGAQPGIVMPADPQIGDVFQQETAPGVAEDRGEVVSLTESVTVPFGSFDDCLQTRDFTPLDPGVNEFKFFCPGVGEVLTREEEADVELIGVEEQ
ncbi:MAG TPA: hypothetical protein VM243_18050 [Phycisphaerae bacterium]|nr:hypothetical protein [Phycisphaerae bacterium]